MTTAGYLFATGLVSALGHLALTNRPPGWTRSVVKTLPLALFALAAWAAAAPVWLTAALILSALGDFALSRPGRRPFLYGLAGFALAHVMFVLLFALLSQTILILAFNVEPIAAAALVALALSTELWLAPHTGGLRWPVRIYVALIVAMGLAALALPQILWLVTLGAGLFILSDLILALAMFRLDKADPRQRWAAWLRWPIYIAGQALILAGVVFL